MKDITAKDWVFIILIFILSAFCIYSYYKTTSLEGAIINEQLKASNERIRNNDVTDSIVTSINKKIIESADSTINILSKQDSILEIKNKKRYEKLIKLNDNAPFLPDFDSPKR